MFTGLFLRLHSIKLVGWRREAVEEVVRHSEFSGVRFCLSGKHCAPALEVARLDAISRVERKVDDLPLHWFRLLIGSTP